MFQQISILGPGLLGASLALAMKERGLCQRVHSWSRRGETRALAMEADWCDAVFDQANAACEGSDLVVVCTPVETIVPLIEQVAPSLLPDALVTDVGSTKSLISREAQGIAVNFIGSALVLGGVALKVLAGRTKPSTLCMAATTDGAKRSSGGSAASEPRCTRA